MQKTLKMVLEYQGVSKQLYKNRSPFDTYQKCFCFYISKKINYFLYLELAGTGYRTAYALA
ncbi:MAG: hypothetical protein KDC92_16690, partial [Bacteroidetes bacterium]|nr:hypothetical protein [Bacteroidota bacterium]